MIINPLILLGIPAFAGMLIYIYRKRGRFVKKVVSSLLFFKGKKQESSRKIKLPLRFWLELLVASLLIIILSGLTGLEKKYLIIIDNSLSSGRTNQKKILLDYQKENAREAILSRTSGSFSVLKTNPPEFLIKDAPSFLASESLAKVSVSNGEDRIQTLLDKHRGYDEILIFSDKDLRTDNIENIAIISADFINDNELEIRVSSKAEIKIEGLEFKKELIVDGQVIVKVPVDEVKVSIVTPNLNRFDDEITVSKKSDRVIHLTSPFSEIDLGLRSLGQFSKERGEVRLIHRAPIPENIDRPTAVIAPSNLTYEKLSISRWDKENELTRYAELSLFNPKEVAPLDIQGHPLIFAEGKPVLVSSIKDGFPFIVLGFEILPYEGKRTPTSSILLINLIKFLTKNLKESFYYESESFPKFERLIVPNLSKSDSKDTVVTYYILLGALTLLLIDGVVRW